MVLILIRKIQKVYTLIRTKIYLKPFKKKGKNVGLVFPLKIEGKYNVSIGDNTAIGTYCHIWGGGGIIIGSNVLIAAHCCITSLGHDYSKPLIRDGLIISKPVVIDDDVWLGYNVTVLPGVTIGKGSVIGAGSVVTKDIPPYSIAIGNPARIVKQRIIDDKVK